MKNLLPFAIILLIAFASCRQTKDVTCDTGSFSFTSVRYTDNDLVGAVISQYQAGSDFSKMLQTGNLTWSRWVRDAVTSDSGNLVPPASMAQAHNPEELTATCDYIITIPALGISDTVSNSEFLGPAHEVMTYSYGRPYYCINQMGSYKFNSQTITPWTTGLNLNIIYLVK